MRYLATLKEGNLVLLSHDEFRQLQTDITNPPTLVEIAIPHKMQYGEGADERRSDCGAACVAMIVDGMTNAAPTVDEIAIAFQRKPNQYMPFSDLSIALRSYGLNANYVRPLRADKIRESIDNEQAIIALIKYPALPKESQAICRFHDRACGRCRGWFAAPAPGAIDRPAAVRGGALPANRRTARRAPRPR